MLQALSTAVDDLDITVDGQSIAGLFSVIGRLQAKAVGFLAAFDDTQQWLWAGAPSLPVWLRVEARMSDRDAQRLVGTARKLRSMPALYAAWCEGRVSTGQIDVIIGLITKQTQPLFATRDVEVSAVVEPLTIVETRAVMRRLAAAAAAVVNDGSDNTDPGSRANRLFLSKTLDGRYKISGDLDTETGELLDAALNLTDSRDLNVAPQQRRGDALRDVAEAFLDHHAKTDEEPPLPGQRRNRPHLHVIIGPDGRGETEDGTVIPPSMIERLKCDARVNTVRFADGQVLYYGKTKRTAPDHLYNALVVRDRGCRFPGCGQSARWCRAHHVVEWDPTGDDGPTDIDNLVLLCGRHHRAIHTTGWHATIQPNAVLIVTEPNGRTRTSRPPGDPDQHPKLFPDAA